MAAGGVAVAACVGVAGDFPLNDDWSYGFATRELCSHGEIRLSPWTGASLVLQAAYGALLCRMAGFSFTLLRASTVAVAVSGAVAVLLLLRQLGVRGGALALGLSCFALSPLYVNLAFTFMTDVPATVAVAWAGYAYLRGLRERRPALLGWGSVAAAIAVLIRQHGIFVAAAAAGAALLAAGRRPDERVRDALVALFLPAVVLVGFHVWLFVLHGPPSGIENKAGEAMQAALPGLVNCAFRGVAYLGLLLSPVAFLLAPGLLADHRRLVLGWCTGLGAVALALFCREGALMFYLPNILYDLGLGPLTLRDTMFLDLPPPVRLGAGLAVMLTVVAVAGAGLLAAAWTSARPRLRDPVPAFLTLATVLLLGGTLLHTRYYFDRYLIIVLPFALAGTQAGRAAARPSLAAVALAVVLGSYAVAGTHDYLAWNRARFAGLEALLASGVPPTAIDGGFEFNGWHLAPVLDRWPRTAADVRRGQPETARSWWWVVDDRFVASFRPLPGYVVRQALPFRRWLPPGTGEVLILERAA